MHNNKTAALLIFIVLCLICLFVVEKSQAATDWQVKITATISQTPPYNADCIFGVKAGATNSFDSAYDQIGPPSPAVGVYAYFAYPNDPVLLYRKLSTSFVPSQDNLLWTYKIQTIGAGGTMTLSWSASEIVSVPSGFSIYLADSTGTTNLRNMRETTSYTYIAETDTTTTITIKILFNPTPTPTSTQTTSPTTFPNPTPTTEASPTSFPAPTLTPTLTPTPSATPINTDNQSIPPQIPEYPLSHAVLIIVAVFGIVIAIRKNIQQNPTQ